jgi:hypothetical protein
MQTFLPYENYDKSAICLDSRRLGKQRVESLQILKSLLLPNYGWKNHPAVRMWRGYEAELVRYSLAICREWIMRGYKDTCAQKIFDLAWDYHLPLHMPRQAVGWITPELCLSHRSNLLRKDRAFYLQKFGEIPDNLPYVWPVKSKVAS